MVAAKGGTEGGGREEGEKRRGEGWRGRGQHKSAREDLHLRLFQLELLEAELFAFSSRLTVKMRLVGSLRRARRKTPVLL